MVEKLKNFGGKFLKKITQTPKINIKIIFIILLIF